MSQPHDRDDIVLPSATQTMETQVYLLLSKIAAKQDVLRERVELHTKETDRRIEQYHRLMEDSVVRIEKRLDEVAKDFEIIEKRIDEVERNFAWVKGGKSAAIAVVSGLAAILAFVGWVATTTGIHITLPVLGAP